jgi:integrase
MTRHLFQQGYVSDPIPTRRGKVFKIRYRVRTAEGKWRHKAETLYGVESKKAARSILLQRIQEASNQPSETAELSLKDFVETYWKPYLQRKNVKPSTEKGYGCVLEVHILPTLGELPLIQISPMHIEELIRGKTRGRSAKTVRNIVAVLQSVFSFAAENDLISKSPVRKKHKPVLTREEKPVWSAEQVRQILAAVPDQARVLFTTVALTGLRLGELLALQWKHVDFERGRLRIQQSLWEGEIVPVKTQSSVRVIFFGEVLAEHLTNHLQRSAHIGPEDFVFTNESGGPLNPDVLRRDVLYSALDRSGIVRPKRASGFHTFRHSAASFLNEQTGNLKLAQRFLGHADISTTANIYTHPSSESEREAAVAIERAIFGDLFSIVPKIENRNSSGDPE